MNTPTQFVVHVAQFCVTAALILSLLGCDSPATVPPGAPVNVTPAASATNPAPTSAGAAPTATVGPRVVDTPVPTAPPACTAPGIIEPVSFTSLPGTVSEPDGIAWLAGRVYVTGRLTGNLGVIEGDALAQVGPLAPIPTVIVADGRQNRLYAVVNNEQSIAVLDGTQVRATITLSNSELSTYHRISALALDPARQRLLAVVDGTIASVAMIDTQTLAVSRWYPLAGYRSSLRIALDPSGATVYLANSRSIETLDLDSGRIVNTVALPDYSYSFFAYDAPTRQFIVDQQPGENDLAAMVDGQFTAHVSVGAHATAPLISGRRLYMAAGISNTVNVVDLDTFRLIATIPVGLTPHALTADSTGSYVYVSTGRSYAQVYVIDTRTNAVVKVIPLSAQPKQLIADETRNRLYALMPSSSEVLVTDGRRVLSAIPIERSAGLMALDESTGRLYVTDLQSNNLIAVDAVAGRVITRRNVPMQDQLSAVAVDPVTQRVFANDRAFALADLSPSGAFSITSYALIGTSLPPYRLVADPVGAHLYALADNGTPGSNGGTIIYTIDSRTLKVDSQFGQRNVTALTLDSTAQRVYWTTMHPIEGVSRLNVADTQPRNYRAELTLASLGRALEINRRTSHLFVARASSVTPPRAAALDVLDTRTLGAAASLPLDADPVAMAILGDRVFIAHSAGRTQTVARDCATAVPAGPTTTPTPTEYPSPTPAPTATVAPTTAPRPTPTVAASTACSMPVARWVQNRGNQDFDLRANLGCPSEPSHTVQLGRQSFQKGVMVWRADNRKIYVIYNNNSWAVYDDTWDASQPEGGTENPPPGLRAPKRGFGKLWRERLGSADGSLGWAIVDERALNGDVQTFDKGLALSDETSAVWLLVSGGRWR
ncbi:MAG: hypothetical protein HZB53_09340 [Chloroflexi bacterium]|nr:hypothetical protein [Chloroflexota bacterium]